VYIPTKRQRASIGIYGITTTKIIRVFWFMTPIETNISMEIVATRHIYVRGSFHDVSTISYIVWDLVLLVEIELVMIWKELNVTKDNLRHDSRWLD
jgi:hypothetical protein